MKVFGELSQGDTVYMYDQLEGIQVYHVISTFSDYDTISNIIYLKGKSSCLTGDTVFTFSIPHDHIVSTGYALKTCFVSTDYSTFLEYLIKEKIPGLTPE